MQEYYGSCHCGNVNFKFLSENRVEIWKCNCSICNMYDYQHLFVKHEDFTLLGNRDVLASYTCLLYTSPSPRDYAASRMPSSA